MCASSTANQSRVGYTRILDLTSLKSCRMRLDNAFRKPDTARSRRYRYPDPLLVSACPRASKSAEPLASSEERNPPAHIDYSVAQRRAVYSSTSSRHRGSQWDLSLSHPPTHAQTLANKNDCADSIPINSDAATRGNTRKSRISRKNRKNKV